MFSHLIIEVLTTPKNPHKVLKKTSQNNLKAIDMFPFVVQQNLAGPLGFGSIGYRHVLDLLCPCRHGQFVVAIHLVSLSLHISLGMTTYNNFDPLVC